MKEFIGTLSRQWKSSGSFRVWTILAAAGFVLYLTQIVVWQMEILSFAAWPATNDLKIYLEAGSRFMQRENLYIEPRADFGLYAYSPAFAMLFGFLTFLPYKILWIIDELLHILFYWVLYWRWFMIFRQQRLDAPAEMLIRLFPLWIMFSGLLHEMAYLNIYIFMALIATLLLEAILSQQTGKAIFWLAILLPVKPQWAFALGIPLLLAQWRFLVKVLSGAILVYTAILTITVFIAGPYALEQYREYVQFLGSIPQSFVWNTLIKDGYLNYNNSIMQLVIFFTNNAPYSIGLATAIKFLLSLPLIMIYWRYRRAVMQPANLSLTLEWAFAFYLLTFIWLDVVTELTLGIVIFVYLLGTLPGLPMKAMAQLIFLPYALTYTWIIILGIAYMKAPLPNIIVDPSRYIPFILIAMVGLYSLILWELTRKLKKQAYQEQAPESIV